MGLIKKTKRAKARLTRKPSISERKRNKLMRFLKISRKLIGSQGIEENPWDTYKA